ncbi:MAG: SBBP repeat-containing protein [Pirellulales bacterium]
MVVRAWIVTASLALCCTASAYGQSLEWTRQLDGGGNDNGWAVSTDGFGSVYISGYTTGEFDGENAGSEDAFVSKFDVSGELQWSRQLGTNSIDESLGVAADELGNVYISGRTFGDLNGTNLGSDDAFLSKLGEDGTLLWTRQFGTNESDEAYGVAVDGIGGIYVSGTTEGDLDGSNSGGQDAFLVKYNADGIPQWTRRFGTTADDIGFGVSADVLGGIFVAGWTGGGLVDTTQVMAMPSCGSLTPMALSSGLVGRGFWGHRRGPRSGGRRFLVAST